MSELNGDYFSTQESSQRLDLIRHLIENSEVVPLVRGPSGSGKSLLALRLQQTAPENWSVCLITANAAMSPDRLLSDIALCAGWGPLTGDLMAGLFSRYEGMRTRGRVPVLLVDDAQELPPSSLITLLRLYERQLAGEPLVSITLFANEHIDMLLSTPQLRVMSPQALQVIDLQPLSRDDATAFMHFILQEEGLPAGLELSELRLSRLYREAKGLPGPLHEAILCALAGEEQSGAGSPARSWQWLLVVPLAALVGLVLLFQDHINGVFRQEGASATSTLNQPADDRLAVGGEEEALSGLALTPAGVSSPDDAQIAEPGPTEPALADDRLHGSEARVPQQVDSVQESDRSADGQVDEPEHSSISGQLVPDQIAGRDSLAEQVVDGQGDGSAEAPGAGLAVAPARLPEQTVSGSTQGGLATEQKDEASGVGIGQAMKASPEAAQAVVQSAEVAAQVDSPRKAQGFDASNQWVLERPPEHYTIQLLGVERLDALHDFLEQNALGDRAFYIEGRRDGKPWYPLLWGEFDSRDAALAEVKQLPAGLSKNAWSRSFSSLQQWLQK